MKNTIGLMLLATLLLNPSFVQARNNFRALGESVRHELNMLPYYTVFDHLSYRVEGQKVVLSGKVSRPVLKSDAENVVKRIPGVKAVENRIEVLPLSGFDDRIRLAELRAVYGNGNLSRYALTPAPPIRIIVDRGHVTLEGAVASQMDRTIAGIAANTVPGVFSVRNNLVVGG